LAPEHRRNEDEASKVRRVGLQLAQDGACLDGLAEPNLIGEQIPDVGILHDATHSVGLMRKQLNTGCIEPMKAAAGLSMAIVRCHPCGTALKEERSLVSKRCEGLYGVGWSKVAADVEQGFIKLACTLLVW